MTTSDRPDPRHVPVLLDRVLALVAPPLQAEGEGRRFLVDATVGLGGHAEAVLRTFPADVLNGYPVDELARVLRDYGEERFARRIAERVVRERERRPFDRSGQLVELLYDAIPAPARRTGGHPAKRTFQALRIEVNDELSVLRRALPAAIEAIGVGGRVVVMSYHSLEDRITKQVFAERTRSDLPPDLPFVPAGHEPAFRLVTRGAEKASDKEIVNNPRAASVRLRALERLRAGEFA